GGRFASQPASTCTRDEQGSSGDEGQQGNAAGRPPPPASVLDHDSTPTTCDDCLPMQSTFAERLKSGQVLLADGATATNYQQMGMAIGVAPEEWVIDRPDAVLQLHQ